MNKAYQRGRRKEYAIVSRLKKVGYDIVQRTAGSHSPIDIIAIRSKDKKVMLIQSKREIAKTMKDIDGKLKRRIEREYDYLNGLYLISFVVL